MKRVLVITFPFPPAGGGGVQRTAKYMKYLQHFGWEPIVLTVKEKYYDLVDETLLSDIPKYTYVYRTRMINIDKLSKRYIQSAMGDSFSTYKRPDFGVSIYPREMLTFILKTLSHHLIVPDYQIGWIPFAVFKGVELCKSFKPDVIYVTAPPYSSYFIALLLHIVFSIPFVVDMRDAWSLNPWLMKEKTRLKQHMELLLEHLIIRHASKVICVLAPMYKDYKAHYPEYYRKFITITNGFDVDDFKGVVPIKRDGRFNIVYTGRLPARCSLSSFFNAVKLLEKTQPELVSNIHITFVGELSKDKEDMLTALSVNRYVTCAGYVSHAKSISYLKGADVLLLLGRGENDRAMLPGKVFEYIAARKPILALMDPHCATARIVRHAPDHRIIANEDQNAQLIASALKGLYRQYFNKKVEFPPSNEYLCYSRRNLTYQLSQAFNTV